MFSKTFGYALRAVTFVAHQSKSGKKVGLHEISAQLNIPHPFLGKIMQDMVKHGVIDSTKGPSGGFFSNKRTVDISLMDILKITDGSLVFETCALGATRCNADQPCPLHNDFAACRDGLVHLFSHKTVGMVANEAAEGHVFLSC